MNHWPADSAACRLGCTKLGESWPEHIADLYEQALEDERL